MQLGFVLGPLQDYAKDCRHPWAVYASFARLNQTSDLIYALHSTVWTVIVTKERFQLPDIGTHYEDPEARKIRRRSTDEVAIDLNSTYTFSFHDMRLDLLQWKITAGKDVDLHSFVGPTLEIVLVRCKGSTR